MSADRTVADSDVDDDPEAEAPSAKRQILRILGRVLVMSVGLVVAGLALASVFDDLEPSEVVDAVRSLDDAESIAVIGGTGVVVWAEALLTASVVPGLPARRGALAWLGPTAVASVIPGPSDMPVRYRMFTSWGYDTSEAGTAVAANALLNIALKLVLPGDRRHRPRDRRHPPRRCDLHHRHRSRRARRVRRGRCVHARFDDSDRGGRALARSHLAPDDAVAPFGSGRGPVSPTVWWRSVPSRSTC
jgi:hypothetical protein